MSKTIVECLNGALDLNFDSPLKEDDTILVEKELQHTGKNKKRTKRDYIESFFDELLSSNFIAEKNKQDASSQVGKNTPITNRRISMALVKCPDCGRSDVSPRGSCPNCGCNIKEYLAEQEQIAYEESPEGIAAKKKTEEWANHRRWKEEGRCENCGGFSFSHTGKWNGSRGFEWETLKCDDCGRTKPGEPIRS